MSKKVAIYCRVSTVEQAEEVYKCEEGIVKVFAKEHPKSDVLNEALNTARAGQHQCLVEPLNSVFYLDEISIRVVT